MVKGIFGYRRRKPSQIAAASSPHRIVTSQRISHARAQLLQLRAGQHHRRANITGVERHTEDTRIGLVIIHADPAEAVEGTYTNTWNNYLGRTDSEPWGLPDVHFFNLGLPKLREERQQGGTAFFDGHVEDGDGKAHYPIKFTIVWDGCPEPVEIIKTIN